MQSVVLKNHTQLWNTFLSKHPTSHYLCEEHTVQNVTNTVYQALTQNLSGDWDSEIHLWKGTQQWSELLESFPYRLCWAVAWAALAQGWPTRPERKGNAQFLFCYILCRIRNKSSMALVCWDHLLVSTEQAGECVWKSQQLPGLHTCLWLAAGWRQAASSTH